MTEKILPEDQKSNLEVSQEKTIKPSFQNLKY